MANLLTFQPKKAVHPSPRHLLRDMAALGAILLYVIDEEGTRIDYQHARQHTARVHVLMARLKDCGEQWHIRYLALVMNLLHIDRDLDDMSPGTCLRLDLASSFVDPFPNNGTEAMRMGLAAEQSDQRGSPAETRSGLDWPHQSAQRPDLVPAERGGRPVPARLFGGGLADAGPGRGRRQWLTFRLPHP